MPSKHELWSSICMGLEFNSAGKYIVCLACLLGLFPIVTIIEHLAYFLALTRFMGGLGMSHSLDFYIREQLAGYSAGGNSRSECEDWFFSETWNVGHITDLALTNLVYGIKLRLAEFSHGDWTEDELRSLLLG
jgi:hypothetical protein